MSTCFVIQGFGKKTDYTDGRVLNLDASYEVIKQGVVAAGLECIRADEIQHSAVIDVPMYEMLLQAFVAGVFEGAEDEEALTAAALSKLGAMV